MSAAAAASPCTINRTSYHNPDCGYQRATHWLTHKDQPVKIGQNLATSLSPEYSLSRLTEQRQVTRFCPTEEWSKPGFKIMYSVPGPFTPVCTGEHLPQIVASVSKLRELNIPVYLVSTSNRDVMWAWAEHHNSQAGKKGNAHEIFMIPDYLADILQGFGLGEDKCRDPSGERAKDRDLGVVWPRAAFLIGPCKLGETILLDMAVEANAGKCDISSPSSFFERITPILKQAGVLQA